MPHIDFNKNMLKGIFLGIHPVIERSQLSLSSVKRYFDPDRIEVAYKIKDWSPAQGGPSLPAYMSNHITFLVPQMDLPVKFIEVKDE